MIVALYILIALVTVGLALWLLDRRRQHPEAPVEPPAECCGQHAVCERDSLLAAVSESVEYFDDEELDAFAGRRPDSYTDEETEAFRDVLLTLLPHDVAPWARSIQLRGIELPPAVREELLMIVSEDRANPTTHA